METLIFVLSFILAILLVKIFIDWLKIKAFSEVLKEQKQELKNASELLNQKDSEFSSYKKNVAIERNLIADGFLKSLFVLENNPEFPKGYDCSDFVVLNVEPLIFREIKNLPADLVPLQDSEKFISFLKILFSKEAPKNSLQEIEKLRPQVYYSYKVFSKLDKKEMVVREEYLQEIVKNNSSISKDVEITENK